MYEMEDGRTPAGGLVRYGFDENNFPRFSWRGYAVFSRLQVKLKTKYFPISLPVILDSWSMIILLFKVEGKDL